MHQKIHGKIKMHHLFHVKHVQPYPFSELLVAELFAKAYTEL